LRKRNIAAPIILITGYPDETIPGRAASAGILYVLRKPHLEESLVGQIRGALADHGTCH
jgi:two-component system response regulator FixJ